MEEATWRRGARAGGAKTLALFDIDGTLLQSGGAGRVAFQHALETVFGSAGPIDTYHFHGKTDPQIALELMGGVGLRSDEVEPRLPGLWPVYVDALERELESRSRSGDVGPLPGIVRLLTELEAQPSVLLGLVTGNIEAGARLKLSAARLEPRFRFAIGGFGSDASLRAEIARIAVDRARERLDGSADGLRAVIVGDTPDDVICARAVSGRAVAVATGRHSADELAAAGADVMFDDLRDTARVLRTILEPDGPGEAPGGMG